MLLNTRLASGAVRDAYGVAVRLCRHNHTRAFSPMAIAAPMKRRTMAHSEDDALHRLTHFGELTIAGLQQSRNDNSPQDGLGKTATGWRTLRPARELLPTNCCDLARRR